MEQMTVNNAAKKRTNSGIGSRDSLSREWICVNDTTLDYLEALTCTCNSVTRVTA